MNVQWYDEIFESLKLYHPYIINDIVDVCPKGDNSIRITLADNTQYDYDSITRGLRRVVEFSSACCEDITDEWCRDSFSYHLIERMSLKGYTQEMLAEYSGLSKGSINKYLNKKATPSATALRKLAEVLDCSIADLLD